ncbi:hypothetical protein [Haladaptatus sp. W1]|uniref:hypothetical protein n=1 Tax=Haladaptatus sp. W1 TaxID=1897478 RepID=UPI001112CFE1|nr:hypothetical protein [Haladaptatus sp. W1]
MDVWMDVEFQLVHDKDGVDIELVLDFETNVIYSMNEIMITGGIAAKVASFSRRHHANGSGMPQTADSESV